MLSDFCIENRNERGTLISFTWLLSIFEDRYVFVNMTISSNSNTLNQHDWIIPWYQHELSYPLKNIISLKSDKPISSRSRAEIRARNCILFRKFSGKRSKILSRILLARMKRSKFIAIHKSKATTYSWTFSIMVKSYYPEKLYTRKFKERKIFICFVNQSISLFLGKEKKVYMSCVCRID